jgi:thioredoxin 1
LTRRIVIGAGAVLVFVAAFLLKESRNATSEADTDPASAPVTERPLPRLVDLGSDKCIPCKKMAPILEGLSKEYRGSLIVEVLDVRKDPALGQKWGIRVIPTQIFLDASGEERFRHEGFMGREAILGKWKELGVELRPSGPGAGS